MSEVEPDYISKTNFYWRFQNNLQIMSDQKTVVGVQCNWEKENFEIVIEDLLGGIKEYF